MANPFPQYGAIVDGELLREANGNPVRNEDKEAVHTLVRAAVSQSKRTVTYIEQHRAARAFIFSYEERVGFCTHCQTFDVYDCVE